MAQEIVKDYETVEKERTITVCDNCGRTDEESEIVIVAINPRKKLNRSKNLHLVETFEDKYEAERFIHEHQPPQIPPTDNNRYGVAWNQHEQITDMNASATADVCSSCIVDLFDTEIEPRGVDGIDIEDGGITVNKTEKKIRNYPRLILKPFSILYIIFCPFLILSSFMDIFSEDETEWDSIDKSKLFISGAMGGIVWSLLIFVLFWHLL